MDRGDVRGLRLQPLHRVRRLRAALDDEASVPRFVETVRGEGYRFIGPIAPPGGARGAVAGAEAAGPRHILGPWRGWASIVMSAGALILAALALLW